MTGVIQDRDGLTFEEAMRQVLDTVAMMCRADPEAAASIEWRLVSANTNSPLTVVAEAKARRPDIDATMVAVAQKRIFRRCVSQLREGRVPIAWNSPDDRRRAKNWLRRTGDGIAATRIDTGASEDPIVLTAEDAKIAEPVLDAAPIGRPREQIGSVEGYLIAVETHYHKPAIRIRERRSRAEITCIVPDEFRKQIAEDANFDDVWRERRVVVRGRVHYDGSGKIDRVTATKVHAIAGEAVDVSKIRDPDCAYGLTAEEFVDQFRTGEIG